MSDAGRSKRPVRVPNIPEDFDGVKDVFPSFQVMVLSGFGDGGKGMFPLDWDTTHSETPARKTTDASAPCQAKDHVEGRLRG